MPIVEAHSSYQIIEGPLYDSGAILILKNGDTLFIWYLKIKIIGRLMYRLFSILPNLDICLTNLKSRSEWATLS